jgi:siroheme synthase-like protein
VRRGPLAVAVSTGGASPALARAVREEIERHLGDDYAVLADVAGDVRRALRAERRPADAAAWRDALADPRLRRLVARGDRAGARQRLRARLSA